MRVLIATTETQGADPADFSNTVADELVFDAGPCSDVRAGDAWDCACAIAFRGLASNELTTTAVVADLAHLGLRVYERAFVDGLKRSGCCTACAKTMAHRARLLALRWPVGTVIERDRLRFQARVLV